MAGWRRAIELALSEEDVTRLGAVARSRTEPASRGRSGGGLDPQKGIDGGSPCACRAYGTEGRENIDKDTIAQAIGEERWREYGRERVFEYCEEDVKMSVKPLRAQLRAADRSWLRDRRSNSRGFGTGT
jgi:hypothetical protein